MINLIRLLIRRGDQEMRFRAEKSDRINLNDLLKRVEEKRKAESKFNFAIIAGTVSIAAIVILVLSF